MKTAQLRPFKKFDLPNSVSQIVDWSLNNGILDVTFDIKNNN
jgi:HSP20 family molecular chaperone IbpA